MESGIIIHDEYGHRVCNICNEEEIYNDNLSGVCNACIDNRVEDGIWTKEQAYSDNLRTTVDGELIKYHIKK